MSPTERAAQILATHAAWEKANFAEQQKWILPCPNSAWLHVRWWTLKSWSRVTEDLTNNLSQSTGSLGMVSHALSWPNGILTFFSKRSLEFDKKLDFQEQSTANDGWLLVAWKQRNLCCFFFGFKWRKFLWREKCDAQVKIDTVDFLNGRQDLSFGLFILAQSTLFSCCLFVPSVRELVRVATHIAIVEKLGRLSLSSSQHHFMIWYLITKITRVLYQRRGRAASRDQHNLLTFLLLGWGFLSTAIPIRTTTMVMWLGQAALLGQKTRPKMITA